MEKDKRLIWVDMEMTGLNPDSIESSKLQLS